MGNRGAERMVRCEKCGRLTRRDKAVFIDKVMLSNPLERKDVHDEQYTRVISREVAYCPSCGKHGRIYEKKKRMLERQRERSLERQYNTRRPNWAERGGQRPATTLAPAASAPAPAAAPAPASPQAQA